MFSEVIYTVFSKFSLHNIFMNFVNKLDITKILVTKFKIWTQVNISATYSYKLPLRPIVKCEINSCNGALDKTHSRDTARWALDRLLWHFVMRRVVWGDSNNSSNALLIKDYSERSRTHLEVSFERISYWTSRQAQAVAGGHEEAHSLKNGRGNVESQKFLKGITKFLSRKFTLFLNHENLELHGSWFTEEFCWLTRHSSISVLIFMKPKCWIKLEIFARINFHESLTNTAGKKLHDFYFCDKVMIWPHPLQFPHPTWNMKMCALILKQWFS